MQPSFSYEIPAQDQHLIPLSWTTESQWANQSLSCSNLDSGLKRVDSFFIWLEWEWECGHSLSSREPRPRAASRHQESVEGQSPEFSVASYSLICSPGLSFLGFHRIPLCPYNINKFYLFVCMKQLRLVIASNQIFLTRPPWTSHLPSLCSHVFTYKTRKFG